MQGTWSGDLGTYREFSEHLGVIGNLQECKELKVTAGNFQNV
jgi:hypothetical protein